MKTKISENNVFTASTGREVVYSVTEGHGSPLIFFNGLGDAKESWAPVLDLLEPTRPCILVDLPGQGAALERDFAAGFQGNYRISIEHQVDHVAELLDYLNISSFGIVGFSYGGGVAIETAGRHHKRIEDLILLSPFILRLDLSLPLSRFVVAQFDFLKSVTPENMRRPYNVLEKSYERFIEHYMHFRYQGRLPDAKYRQVAVELTHGIMEYNSFDAICAIPDDKLFLATSGMDTLVPQSLYQEFWYRIPNHKKRAWIDVMDGGHLLLEQSPEFVATFLRDSLQRELYGVRRASLRNHRTAHRQAGDF